MFGYKSLKYFAFAFGLCIADTKIKKSNIEIREWNYRIIVKIHKMSVTKTCNMIKYLSDNIEEINRLVEPNIDVYSYLNVLKLF